MALTKAIEHHKEYRKLYRGSKAFDRSCRNHGSCSYCSSNRQINKLRGIIFQRAYENSIEYYYDDILYYERD